MSEETTGRAAIGCTQQNFEQGVFSVRDSPAMAYIGCNISLITKTEIRYTGSFSDDIHRCPCDHPMVTAIYRVSGG
jgi:hypothetical protein